MWYESLHIGGALPTMPLFLKKGPHVGVDLAATYVQTCRDLRIPQG